MRADLVVHDRTQAHDADMDVVFLADQSGVLQGSSAWQCVASENIKKFRYTPQKLCGVNQHPNTHTIGCKRKQMPFVNVPPSHTSSLT